MNTENNKMIAEFMGGISSSVPNLINMPQTVGESHILCVKGSEALPNGTYSVHRLNELKYHNDWNWLMKVVSKIENLRTIEDDGYYDFTIFSDAVFITKEANRDDIIIINKSEVIGSINHECVLFEDKITSVYWACIIFIKWYNENKK